MIATLVLLQSLVAFEGETAVGDKGNTVILEAGVPAYMGTDFVATVMPWIARRNDVVLTFGWYATSRLWDLEPFGGVPGSTIRTGEFAFFIGKDDDVQLPLFRREPGSAFVCFKIPLPLNEAALGHVLFMHSAAKDDSSKWVSSQVIKLRVDWLHGVPPEPPPPPPEKSPHAAALEPVSDRDLTILFVWLVVGMILCLLVWTEMRVRRPR